MASCAGARLILKITFDEQSTTIPRTVEPDLYELASATRAYQVTALSLIARASPEETSSRNETLALARRRASVVREALIKVGVPAGVIVADAEVAVCSGSPCTTLKVQSEELSAEQMRSGHGFPRRRKECTSGLIFRSELRVTGQEGKLTVELCRNGVCSRFVEDAARLVAWPSERVEAMQGSLSAFLRLTPTEDQVERTLKYYYSERTEPAEYLLEIRHEARPEQLSSGDRYRASVYRGEKPDPYLQVSRKVAYQESYPNGPEHDPVPCRHATIEARVESSSSSP